MFSHYENKLGSWWRDLSNNNTLLLFTYMTCWLILLPRPSPSRYVSRQPVWQYWGSIFDAFFFPISSVSLPSASQQVVASKKPRSLFHPSPSLACLHGNVPLGATWGMTFKKAIYCDVWGFPDGSVVKISPAMQETQVRFLGWEVPWKRAWQPTPVVLPGESHGQSLAGYTVHEVAKSRPRLKWPSIIWCVCRINFSLKRYSFKLGCIFLTSIQDA